MTPSRMANAAGHWQRIQRTKERRPYLRYVSVLDERTRDQHRAWHGKVLAVDDPFWDSHFPPNGWRCRCLVQHLSQRDVDRFGYKVSRSPIIKTKPWENKRTGEVLEVPQGIDPGFDYNVGKARLRAFTPPPQGGLPTSFPPGNVLPPLPPPRSAPPSRLLPDNLQAGEYVRRFLNEFDAAPGAPKIFTDKSGEDLVISEAFFGVGGSKARKAKRHPNLLLLADAIKDPDEIWWIWEELKNKPGSFSLRRRYITRWTMPDKQISGMTVFEHGRDGWKGKTTFAPKADKPENAQDAYLKKQRAGTLAYRRK